MKNEQTFNDHELEWWKFPRPSLNWADTWSMESIILKRCELFPLLVRSRDAVPDQHSVGDQRDLRMGGVTLLTWAVSDWQAEEMTANWHSTQGIYRPNDETLSLPV